MTDASRPDPAHRPAPTGDGRITDKGCRDVLLFLAHDTRPGAMAELRRIIAECSAHLDVVPLFDGSHNDIDRTALPEGSLVITYDEVVEGLAYPEKLKYRPGHFVDRDLDLPVIWFFRRYGGYRRYWLTEYDVRFSGHWMVLFDHFRDNASDLLATTIFEPSVRLAWAHWHTFQGPSDIPLEQRCRATMSFYGLSHRGLAELHRAYREGYAGNYELMIPTLLKSRGLTLEDIGGNGRYVAPENINRFYLNTPEVGGLAPGTFVLRESGKIDREMPNMLWNPFKD